MTQTISPIDIPRLPDRSNCHKCRNEFCLAFSGAVDKGEAMLQDCRELDNEITRKYERIESAWMPSDELNGRVEELKAVIPSINLAIAGERLGVNFSDGKLTVKILGKDISVDAEGNIFTRIHVHRWMATLVYTYIIYGAGNRPTGRWITFREMDSSGNLFPLFEQRCEKQLKRVADNHADLFEDILHIFGGKQVDYRYWADISILLYPLPKVPIMICYSKPKADIESNLSVFFDSIVTENLGFEAACDLGMGLARMFEKIAVTHGAQTGMHPRG